MATKKKPAVGKSVKRPLAPKAESGKKQAKAGRVNVDRFYVYSLVDPRTGETFYVGKGCGGRVKQHVKEARCSGAGCNLLKVAKIRSILADGLDVTEVIIQDGLSEHEALRVERGYITALRDSLTNIASGGVPQTREAKNQAFFSWCAERLTALVPYDEWLRKEKRSDQDREIYRFVKESMQRMAKRWNGAVGAET